MKIYTVRFFWGNSPIEIRLKGQDPDILLKFVGRVLGGANATIVSEEDDEDEA